jgi:ubiquinone/menaquinone biosynthesis C-methylase UbiE
MRTHSDALNQHYAPTDICARILGSLRQAGKDLTRLSRDDLAAFDEFHGGGRESTRELARLAGLRKGMRVLDIGSGVGGPARTLATEFGCRVTGIDLTAEYCRAAQMLTEMVGIGEGIEFCCGNAATLPFADQSFDVVWSQNSLMNIEAKAQLFAEINRVLRPGGLFAFEAVLAGPKPGLHYPVFWASSPALSFLVTPPELRALLDHAALRERTWEYTTDRTIAGQKRRKQAAGSTDPSALGIAVIVPAEVAAKIDNGLRNNEEHRTVSVQAVYQK